MHSGLSRRVFLGSAAAAFSGGLLLPTQPGLAAPDALDAAFEKAEKRLGARLGAYVRDTGNGRSWLYRADERFPMNSTFKIFACAALLERVDAGREDLSRRIRIRKSDLQKYAPVTEKRVGAEMSLLELCEAAAEMSDNTAANLILGAIGGPAGFTDFMRSLGDTRSRLDRLEPDLNQATPGDPRDTTTPEAISASLERLALGDALSPNSRDLVRGWLLGNKVSDALFRAGVPADWRVGDRTGAGGHGSRGIVAILWPPQRAPLLATVYITETDASFADRNAAIAEIGRTISAVLS